MIKKTILTIIILSLLILGYRLGAVKQDIKPYLTLTDMIKTSSTKYGVSPKILLKIIKKESSLKSNSIGDQGRSLGLGQIQYKLWGKTCKLKKQDFLIPSKNIDCSAKILALNLSKHGNYFDAVTAYNGSGKQARKYARDILNVG